MSPQSAPHIPADTHSPRRRRTTRIYLGMVIGIFALAAAAVASGFLPSQRPATADDISQTYGVEVLDFNRSADPELITVQEPGGDAVICQMPSRQELENREPLRDCTPVTTIPAK